MDGAGRGRYRAIARVNRWSPEITIMSEADTVHKGAGSILITMRGEVMRTRRGLREWRDIKWNSYELGRADVFPKRML
jgi:hypothetical protein